MNIEEALGELRKKGIVGVLLKQLQLTQVSEIFVERVKGGWDTARACD